MSKPLTRVALAQALQRWSRLDAATAGDADTAKLPAAGADERHAPAIAGAVAEIRGIGGQALLDRVLRLFLETTPSRLGELDAAASAGDAAALVAAAHPLKSSAAHLGALRLSELARQLETQARAGQLAQAASLVAAMKNAYSEAATMLVAAAGPVSPAASG